MRKKNIVLAGLATVLVLSATIESAWSYFTTFATAKGGYSIELGEESEIRENFSSWTKKVSVHVSDDSEPVFVRAKAFCGSEYKLIYSDENGKWNLDTDGWYYYSDIVNGGGDTELLNIKIENVPQEVMKDGRFHVAVVYETTPVLYDSNGNAYADWTFTLNSGDAEGGNN